MMPPPNLSDYWRIDRSEEPSAEQASVLGGVSGILELLGLPSQVQWTGTGFGGGTARLIHLAADAVADLAAPFDGRRVDPLVGCALRDAGRRAWGLTPERFERFKRLGRHPRYTFKVMLHVLEEAHVVHRLTAVSTAAAAYLDAFRRNTGPQASRIPAEVLESAPDPDTLVQMWAARHLFDLSLPPGPYPPRWRRALDGLETLAAAYVRRNDPRQRMVRAERIWAWLTTFPRSARPSRSEWFQAPDRLADLPALKRLEPDRAAPDETRGGSGQGELKNLSAFLDIPPDKPLFFNPRDSGDDAPHTEDRVHDITSQLSRLGVSAAVTRIKEARYDAEAHHQVRGLVRGEIECLHRLFARVEQLQARMRHGLTEGRLDGRRLTRAAVGKQTVFKRRDPADTSSLALVLLMDVSASMDAYLQEVNKAACIFADALRPLAPRIWFDVWTYTGAGLHQGADVQLSRLAGMNKPLSLKEIWLQGGTPTAEGLAAALWRLRVQPKARRLIIHYTDGHPKDERTVRRVLELCAAQAVEVLTISVKMDQAHLYGTGRVAVIDTAEDLPEAVTGMLQRLFRKELRVA